jgi:hypothetical protein
MSNDTHATKVPEEELPGEWWYLAGALMAEFDRDGVRYYTYPRQQAVSINVYIGPVRVPSRPTATITLRAVPAGTAVGHSFDGENVYWKAKYLHLKAIAQNALSVHKMVEPTYDELVERYYRSRSQHGRRVTLRQIAEEAGVSYASLRKRKMEYDQRGGWGSNKPEQSK